MIDKPFAALHVLVTRPLPQQQDLVAAIEAASGHVLQLPLLDIKGLTTPDEPVGLIGKIQNLDNYRILIFVSTNAVRHGVYWIEQYWPQFPAGVQLVAIGPGTARALSAALGQHAIHSDAGTTSEDLLQLPVFTDVRDMRIGIVRGRGGRELLAQTLQDRGAVVDYLEVYERQLAPYVAQDFGRQLQTHAINVFTVSSGESMLYLAQLLRDNKAQMSLIPLLVPSQRVAEQASTAGFKRVINTGGADVASYMTALADLAGAASA